MQRREAEIDELLDLIDHLETRLRGSRELICLLTERGLELKRDNERLQKELGAAKKTLHLYESDDLK
jgi:hypothetical protein